MDIEKPVLSRGGVNLYHCSNIRFCNDSKDPAFLWIYCIAKTYCGSWRHHLPGYDYRVPSLPILFSQPQGSENKSSSTLGHKKRRTNPAVDHCRDQATSGARPGAPAQRCASDPKYAGGCQKSSEDPDTANSRPGWHLAHPLADQTWDDANTCLATSPFRSSAFTSNHIEHGLWVSRV
jgi:hypothetical protein